MAGNLEFALALDSAQFSKSMGEALSKTVEFIGVAEGARKVLEGFTSAFEKGSRLFGQRMATGESIRSLYQMGEALKSVGVSSEEGQGLLFRLEKSLSGVSDTGERTDNVFAALGLNMVALRDADPAEQLMRVADALGQVNQTSAVGASSVIFGREGASTMVQISRQAQIFRDAFKDAASGGNVFARVSEPFTKALRTIDEIKSRLLVAFASAAEGFIGPLQDVLDLVKSIPWAEYGHDLGDILAMGLEIMKSGKLGEALEATMLFALRSFMSVAVPAFEELGHILLQAMAPGLEKKREKLRDDLGTYGAWGMTNYKTYDKTHDAQNAQIEARYKSGKITKKQYLKELSIDAVPSNSLTDGLANLPQGKFDGVKGQLSNNLAQLKGDLLGILGPDHKAPVHISKDAPLSKKGKDITALLGGDGGKTGVPGGGGAYHPSANAFEKMGFIFSGHNSSQLDYSRRTAVAAEKTAAMLAGLKGKSPTEADLELRNAP